MIEKSRGYRTALLCAVGAAALFASPVLAEPMLLAETTVAPNFGVGESDSDSSTPTASAFSSFFDGPTGQGSAYAVARTNYESTAIAGIDGSGEANATATLTETVVNTSAVNRDYFFTFQINGGSMISDSTSVGTLSTDEVSALATAVVSVDGSAIWSIAVEIGLENEVYSLVDGNDNDDGTLVGFDTAFSTNSGQASWDTSVFTVGLGELAPGDDLDLEYILAGDIEATYGSFCSLGEDDIEFEYGCAFTSVSLSDPGAITMLGIASTVVPGTPSPPPPPTTVAEPASLALLGIGLAGLGLQRRRRFDL